MQTFPATARNDAGYILQLAAALVELQRQQVATLTPITANYIANTPNEVILADATAGAVSVSLPKAKGFYGRTIFVKKMDSGGNAVTLTPQTGELIDGSASKAISTQYMSYTVTSTGTAWVIV